MERILFYTADERHLVAVGRDLLSANTLRPYDGWTAFRERLRVAIEAYVAVGSPAGVVRVGLRYINRLVVPMVAGAESRYFKIRLAPPDAMSPAPVGFLVRTEHQLDGPNVKLLMTWATVGAQPGNYGYLLDLDVVQEWPDSPLPIADVLTAVDEMKVAERAAFESLITDAARELFDG